MDRVHGLLLGWELPKIKLSGKHLSQGYGVASDYFCEVTHELRKHDDTHFISESSNRLTTSFWQSIGVSDQRYLKPLPLNIIAYHKRSTQAISLSDEQEKLAKITRALRDSEVALNIGRIAKIVKMSRSTASKYLQILKSQGKVEEDNSEKPYKKYRLRHG